MLRILLAVASCVGCGRIAFDNARGDGGGSDADNPDAASACPGLVLCEGFEDPTLASYWDPQGTFERDTGVFNRGGASMRFTTPILGPNIGSRSSITQYMTFEETPNTIYVRAFVRASGTPANNNQFPVMLISEPTNGFENSLYVRSSTLTVYNQWSDTSSSSNMALPTNTWLCVLWSVTRSTTATGGISLAGDVAAASLSNVVTDTTPPLASMSFGIILYAALQPQNPPSLQLWIDDILVDDAPLSCAQ